MADRLVSQAVEATVIADLINMLVHHDPEQDIPAMAPPVLAYGWDEEFQHRPPMGYCAALWMDKTPRYYEPW